MNAQYLKKKPPADLAREARPHLEKAGYPLAGVTDAWLESLVKPYLERMETLEKFAQDARFFFVDAVAYDPKAVAEVLKKEGAKARLEKARAALAALPAFDAASVNGAVQAVTTDLACKMGDVAQPLRVAVTGTKVSPPIHDTLAVLGREKTLKRIDEALRQI
jgi:glutamyl-tRNA synthetase